MHNDSYGLDEQKGLSSTFKGNEKFPFITT
jgi:hypothetical protein